MTNAQPSNSVEKASSERPWQIIPVEGVSCPECHNGEVSQKVACNYAACPYSNEGEW